VEDVLEWIEDGIERRLVAVEVVPLQVTDPQNHLGELLGVGVDLQAEELRRPDQRDGGEVVVGGVVADFLFQVEQQVDGDVEKVARAAGRVEDAIAAEACPELGIEAARLGQQPALLGWCARSSAPFFGLPDFRLDPLPFPASGATTTGSMIFMIVASSM